MNFNETIFIAFFGAVFLLHTVLPWRVGRYVLLVASYVFYGAATPWYCLLLLASTLVDFAVALRIPKASTPAARRGLLATSVLVNVGLLLAFKYGDFIVGNLNVPLAGLGIPELPLLGIIAPVGISFYTFQTLSYTIDVYRGRCEPTRDFARFALFVSFFPQLVAGPIERATTLLPQLTEKHRTTREDLEHGFQRALWGLTKKLVLADRLGVFVDSVFAAPADAPGSALLLANYAYLLQLYLDLSAYADIAIGLARMMGIRLSENFNWPLVGRNISAFWSRWHITLTSWFGDYVYVPMGGRRRSHPLGAVVKVILLMTLIGLWHGASWPPVFCGIALGVLIGLHQAARNYLPRRKRGPLLGLRWWSRPLGMALTTTTIALCMTLFRSTTLGGAWTAFAGIFTHPWSWQPRFALYIGLMVAIIALHVYRGLRMSDRRPLALPPPVRGAFWAGMVLLIIVGGVDTTEQFIYFQF